MEQGVCGVDRQLLIDAWTRRSQELAAVELKPIVLLAEADAAKFLAGFLAATAADCPLVLGNPGWAIEEWRQVFELVRPGLVWAEGLAVSDLVSHLSAGNGAEDNWFNSSGRVPILIPTGGSSGKIRFAVHTWETLAASVDGFQQYFECEQIHSCCVLPLYHVSGLMQVMRSVLTRGTLAVFSSKAFESSAAAFDPSSFFLSLVPTQLQRLLQNSDTAQWLSRFQTVMLGGAPAWEELLQQAKQHQIRLAPTYGMTETASQVVTLKPADFLSGKAGCGRVLPHAAIRILDETGSELPTGATGTIAIQAASLMLGYCPGQTDSSVRSQFLTDDLGYFDAQGYLHLVGRNSQKIITGGENVFPVEVEAAIRSTGLVKDVCVVGVGDRHWGEVVTAVCVAIEPQVSTAKLEAALENRLAKYKRPKRWVLVPELPRNAQGKISYPTIARLCSDQCTDRT
ncbi:2-succinylbenzoate--CoA ligase [Phormidium tenue FACHB-886]|nr:2-succinylbenzoate--CoA ligase [Phormidium tenue FACHB-886]